MPIFEFQCEDDDCGHRFERILKASDDNPKCPKCKRPTKRLLPRNVGLVFKGSGFYATDYKNKD